MKTLFRTDKYVLVAVGIVAAAVVISCAQNPAASGRTGKVEITQDMIVLHPTVQLAAADEKAMNDVLKNYSTALYKIDTVENGTVKKTQGSLKQTSMTAAVKAESASSEAQAGGSHKSHQMICPAPCNQTNPPPIIIPPISAATLAKRQQLIKDLKPIVQRTTQLDTARLCGLPTASLFLHTYRFMPRRVVRSRARAYLVAAIV